MLGTANPEFYSGAEELMGSAMELALSKRRAALVITTVAGVNFLNTMGSGILTVALPTMAKDLGLGVELLLWYVIPRCIFVLLGAGEREGKWEIKV